MNTVTTGPVLREARGILAAAAADPWGNDIDTLAAGAAPPAAPDGEATPRLPRLSGFVESRFSPLAYAVGRQCLTAWPGDGARTAMVLASLLGDSTTFDLTSARVVGGRVHNPLLFMQSTTNSVLGYLSQEFQITAQTLSLSTLADPAAELLAMADVLLDDPELDRVLCVAVELAGTDRVAAAHRDLAKLTGRPERPAPADLAVALLVGRTDDPAAVSIRSAPLPGAPTGPAEPTGGDSPRAGGHCGDLQGLLALAAAHEHLRHHGGSRTVVTDPAARRGPTAFTLTQPEGETHGHTTRPQ